MPQTFTETFNGEPTVAEATSSLEEAYLFQVFRSMREKFNLVHHGMMAYPDEIPDEVSNDVGLLQVIAYNLDSMEASTVLMLINDYNYREWGTTTRMEDPEYAEAFAALQEAMQLRTAELGIEEEV